MKINSFGVANVLAQLQVPPELQGNVLRTALGRAIGYSLPIPVESSQGNRQQFDAEHAANVGRLIEALNETVPVGYDATLELVFNVWSFRVNLAHNCMHPAVVKVLDEVSKIDCFGKDADFTSPYLDQITRAICSDLGPAE